MAGPVAAFVALGSNLGDRSAHLDRALASLEGIPGVRLVSVSAWLETEAVGGPAGQPPFLNGAVHLATTLELRDFFERLQAVEAGAGRDRTREVHHGPRTLDLDLLLFGDQTCAEPDLVVPHAELEHRFFVLAPLAQIAPNLTLPSGRTVSDQLARLASNAPTCALVPGRGATT